MKKNSNPTALQNNPVIRETRKAIKQKISEIEEILFDKMAEVKEARIQDFITQLSIKDERIKGQKTEINELTSKLHSLVKRLELLEKHNEKLEDQVIKLKALSPGRKYSLLDVKKVVLATMVEANLQVNGNGEEPIVPLDKIGLFVFKVCESPDDMVPPLLKNYWGK